MNFFKRLKDLLYAIPFGMKAGDEILTTSNVNVDDGEATHQQVEHHSLWEDLLKGELTQQVEELRYETFKSEEMANEYEYIGNGQARKKKSTPESIIKKRKCFIQYNVDEEYGLKESLQVVANDQHDKYDFKTRKIFKIEYKNQVVKFKIENLLYKVKVILGDDKYETYFYFIDDKYNRECRPLINHLKKTKKELELLNENDIARKTYISKNETLSDILSFKFTTLNATNDVPNGVDYVFSKPTFESITEEDGYVVLKYSWESFDGNKLLSERFKSNTGEEKINKKARREGFIPKAEIKNTEAEELRTTKRNDCDIDDWIDSSNLENKQ